MSQPKSTLPTSTETCGCDQPLPVQRAERKGAAVTVCLSCGLRIPLRLQ